MKIQHTLNRARKEAEKQPGITMYVYQSRTSNYPEDVDWTFTDSYPEFERDRKEGTTFFRLSAWRTWTSEGT